MYSKIQIDGIDTKRFAYANLVTIVPTMLLVAVMVTGIMALLGTTIGSYATITGLPFATLFISLGGGILGGIILSVLIAILMGVCTVIAATCITVAYNRLISNHYKVKFFIEHGDELFSGKKDFCFKKINVMSYVKTQIIVIATVFVPIGIISLGLIVLFGLAVGTSTMQSIGLLVILGIFGFALLFSITAIGTAFHGSYYNYVTVKITGGIRFFCSPIVENEKDKKAIMAQASTGKEPGEYPIEGKPIQPINK